MSGCLSQEIRQTRSIPGGWRWDAERTRLTFRYRTRSWTVVVEPDGPLVETSAASNNSSATPCGQTIDVAAARLLSQRLEGQPQLFRKQVRRNGDLAVFDRDGGRSQGTHYCSPSANVRFIAECRPGAKLMQSCWSSASVSASPT